MEIKEFIIELIKVDKVHNDMIETLLGFLDDGFLNKMLPEYGESLEDKIMDFIGIPKNDYDDEKNPDGYCRDWISEEYWRLRYEGKFEDIYKLLVDAAKEMKD